MLIKSTLAAVAALALSACATGPAPMMYSQAMLPASVQVPMGHQVVMETVGAGDITCECRTKANMAGVTCVQRVATVGGVAPAMACGATNLGSKQIVKYQADHIFYKVV